jgi:hypothetical protein
MDGRACIKANKHVVVLTSSLVGELGKTATVMVCVLATYSKGRKICGRPEWRHSQRSSRGRTVLRQWRIDGNVRQK